MVPLRGELTRESVFRSNPASLAVWASHHKWRPYRHLEYVSMQIALAMQKPGARILINMPPRVGKSLLISKWVPIWFLERDPTRRVLLCTYGDDLAASFGRDIRNEIATSDRLRVRLSDDSRAVNQWSTSMGGGLRTAGVGSGITGFGGSLCLLDDPYATWDDAYSASYRRKLEDWWSGTFLDRVEPGGAVVLLHHRWHPDDLTAHILKGEDGARWTHIRLPAFAEPGDPLGREPGEPLAPERYPAEEWERTQVAIGPAAWSAKYQQAPKSIGAGLVYPAFSEANIDPRLTLDPRLPLCVAFDFNINPGMHALIGQYDSMTDRFTFVHEIHDHRMALGACLTEIGKLMAAQPQGWKYPKVQVFADASGSSGQINTGESALTLITRQFGLWGVPVSMLVPKSNPGVADRIAAMNDALCDQSSVRHIAVHPRCVRLLTDFRELRLDAAGEIDKAHRKLSHASDAVGYEVEMMRPAGGRIEFPKGKYTFKR